MHPLLRLELGLAAPLANKAVVVALFKLLILGIAGLQEKWHPQHCGLGFRAQGAALTIHARDRRRVGFALQTAAHL